MINALTPTGLTIQTLQDAQTQMVAALQAIYGIGINVNPESPDGQLVMAFCQGKIDVLELIQAVYNSFDPDQAVGSALDLRCAINWVQRRVGTYTNTLINVTAIGPANLVGLDLSNTPFTVQDSAGNQYQLNTSFNFLVAGSEELMFQASIVGAVTPALNSITTVVTVQNNISTVTNDSATGLVIGTPYESDARLRLRRQQSVALPSKSWYQGLIAALLSSTSPTFNGAQVYENTGPSIDANGIPGHGIWTVIDDSSLYGIHLPSMQALANYYGGLIFPHLGAGCNQKNPDGITGWIISFTGSAVPGGATFNVYFDQPVLTPLYISINAQTMPGGPALDPSAYKAALVSNFGAGGDGQYSIGGSADASEIIAFLKNENPLVSFNSEGVSLDGITYYPLILCDGIGGDPSPQAKFTVATANIKVNGV